MIIELQPTAEQLEELRSITQKNLDNIWRYTGQGVLEFTLAPFYQELLLSEEPSAAHANLVYFTLRDVLQNGGRILLLTPDSDVSQELVLNNED